MPVDLQVGMQAALHQNSRSAKFDGLTDLLVNGFEVEDVSLFRLWALQWPIKSTKSAVLGAVVGVINVAINDVGGHAFRMKPTAHRIGFHPDADQIIGMKQVKRLLFGQSHGPSRGQMQL